MFDFYNTKLTANRMLEIFKTYIWEGFDLVHRSMIFARFDSEYGDAFIDAHITTPDEIYDSEEWYEWCTDYAVGIPLVHVYNCTTFILGDGEAEIADSHDVMFLKVMLEEFHGLLNALIEKYADVLSTVGECDVDNPSFSDESLCDDDMEDE